MSIAYIHINKYQWRSGKSYLVYLDIPVFLEVGPLLLKAAL